MLILASSESGNFSMLFSDYFYMALLFKCLFQLCDTFDFRISAEDWSGLSKCSTKKIAILSCFVYRL